MTDTPDRYPLPPMTGWYVKKAIPTLCVEWRKNGDHEAVHPFSVALNGLHEDERCAKCAHKFKYHGWIDTLEDGHNVCPGDWIARGIRGEYWPIKPDIFALTYERTEDQ